MLGPGKTPAERPAPRAPGRRAHVTAVRKRGALTRAAAARAERPRPAQRRPRGRGNPPGSLPGRGPGEVRVVTAADFPHGLRGKHRPRAARMGRRGR